VSARARAKTTGELYAFSRKLAAIGALDDLLWATAYQVSAMLNVRTVLLLPSKEGGSLDLACGYPPEDQIDEADMAAARWTWETQSRRRPRFRHIARRQMAVSATAHRKRPLSASSASTATRRAPY